MKISDTLQDLKVPVTSLVVHPDNPRVGDVGAISLSLERFGQMKPIVVNGDGLIIAGNHTYKAAVAIGADEIAVVMEVNLTQAEIESIGFDEEALNDLYETVQEAETGFRMGDERFTPEWLFEAMDVRFDVDVAGPKDGVPWLPADAWYHLDDDGLEHDWTGQTVWCNPPFSLASTFGRKFLEEVTDGVWLGPVSHGSEYAVGLMKQAEYVWIPREIKFHLAGADGEGIGFPIFLAGFGALGSKALRNLTTAHPDNGVLLEAV